MLVIEECKNSRAVTIFIRGGNKMVSNFQNSYKNNESKENFNDIQIYLIDQTPCKNKTLWYLFCCSIWINLIELFSLMLHFFTLLFLFIQYKYINLWIFFLYFFEFIFFIFLDYWRSKTSYSWCIMYSS